jgi:hypothetical protein
MDDGHDMVSPRTRDLLIGTGLERVLPMLDRVVMERHFTATQQERIALALHEVETEICWPPPDRTVH